MKIFSLLLVLKVTIIILSGCYGPIEPSTHESSNYLYGSWKHVITSPAKDSLIIIYNFSSPNILEISEYGIHHTNRRDTFYSVISYIIPSPNLLFKTHDYRLSGDSIVYPVLTIDTVIFEVGEEALQLCFDGRFFNQIIGKQNQLPHGSFYKMEKYVEDIYIHELYKFSEDSLYYYFTANYSTDFPKDWNHFSKYMYSIKETILIMDYRGYINLKGFKFYKDFLIIAESPRIFKRYQKE